MTLNGERQMDMAVVLAAGLGTRMKSVLPKVLHAVASRSMLGHSLSAAQAAGIERIAVIVGRDMPNVVAEARACAPQTQCFVQEERLGTAHAVLAARQVFCDFDGAVFILYGDTPLIPPEALMSLREAIDARGSVDIAVLGFEAGDPTGYGRLLLDAEGRPEAIREHNDASAAERAITLCNSGVLAVRSGRMLAALLDEVRPDNAKREYYLTDIIAIGRARNLKTALVTCAEEETLGVNDRVQLARAEAVMQRRLREAALLGGATLIAPETVTFAFDTKLGQDVLIEPNVVFGPGVTVEDGAVIRAFSHIEGAHIGHNAQIGPYARLRPGARLGEGARIGNFVEIKNAAIEDGAKVNHLSYIGDARVGAGANVGAGTITCNYDGFDKHHTDIGEGAFIGSNSSLVAPVKIGKGAYVGSGSVITRDVEADALAVARGVQADKPRWAAIVRERRLRERKPPHV